MAIEKRREREPTITSAPMDYLFLQFFLASESK
jgi:hypothetical protein